MAEKSTHEGSEQRIKELKEKLVEIEQAEKPHCQNYSKGAG